MGLIDVIHSEKASGVAFRADRWSTPIFFAPFKKGHVTFAAALPDKKLLIISNLREAVVVSLGSGDVVRAGTLERAGAQFALSRDGTKLFSYVDSSGLAIYDAQTLSIMLSARAVLWTGDVGKAIDHQDYFSIDKVERRGDARRFHSEALRQEYLSGEVRPLDVHALAERPDGTLLLLQPESAQPQCWKESCLMIDVASRAVRRMAEIAGRTEAYDWGSSWRDTHRVIEPVAVLALTRHTEALPFSDGTPQPHVEAFGVSFVQINDHPDVVDDAQPRFGLMVRVYALGNPALPPRDVVVRMMTVAELGYTEERWHVAWRFLAAAFASGHAADVLDRAPTCQNETTGRVFPVTAGLRPEYTLQSKILSIVCEPSGEAFWVCFKDLKLRRVSFDGKLGPLVQFARWMTVPRAGRVEFCLSQDGRPTLHCSELGTVSFDPALLSAGSAVTVDVDSDCFEPVGHLRAAFDRFADALAATKVQVSGWTTEACDAALTKMTKRMARNFAAVTWGRNLRLNFEVAGEPCTEQRFFDEIVSRNLPLQSVLRDLLATYLKKIGKGGEGRQLWQSEEVPALGFAMRALVLLDASALDVFREFVRKRDAEHESYCRRVILRDFVARHGWRDIEAVKFGVYFHMHLEQSGLVGFKLDTYGLVTAAEHLVPADVLAGIIVKEAMAFPHRAAQVDAFGSMLEREANGYGLAVARELRLARQ